MSGLYSICCQYECVNLLGKFEERTLEPSALPEDIADSVSMLPSDTLTAPGNLFAGEGEVVLQSPKNKTKRRTTSPSS